jgi:hypothetical protein
MKGNRAALAVVMALVLLAAAWLFFRRSSSAPPVQLIPVFASAEKRPAEGTFDVIDADLNGETKRAIATPSTSRIIYKVRIPDNAWLRVAVGMKPESWTEEGNGVLFFAGVSDGRDFQELFRQHVNPFAISGDRRWIQVWVDLSAYSGEDVELILNTRPGPDDDPADARNDLPLWGDPEIIVR